MRMLEKLAFAASLSGFLSVATASLAQPGSRWAVFANDKGTTVQYPADLFPDGRDTQKGRSFATADGRATLDIYAGPNEDGASPAQVVRRTVKDKRARLTYDRVASNFFAISTRYNNRILYRRCNFDSRMIHCIDLAYPLSEKRAWDYNVTRISRSLRPL
jgi:hypothetical protein